MKKFIISLFFLIGCAGFAAARNYALVSYNADNGLSHNTVRCIAQDQRGFMWIGTADGLNRFDGIAFRAYNSENLRHGLLNTSVHALCADRKNRLWVGTEQGVYLYDERKDVFFPFSVRTQYGVVITGRITRIFENGDGKIWIGTEAQGFFIYHPEDGELEQNSRLADAVTDMVGGPDWNVFVSARNGTVAEFDSEGKQRLAVYSKEQGGHVPSIRSLCYSNDELWGCFETDGLAKMTWSGDSAAKWTHRRDLSAQVLLPLSRGELMIGSDDGLFVYYTGSGQVDSVTDMTARGENYTHTVNALYRDREGGIWVATQYNGITYLPRRLKPIEHMSLRIAERGKTLATAFAEDDDSSLWVAIDKRGVLKVDAAGRVDEAPFRGGSESFRRETKNVRAMLVAGGRLWLGTMSGGVYACDLKTGAVRNYRNDPGVKTSLCDDDVETLFSDDAGTVYAGTPWGFARYDRRLDDFVRVNKGGNDLSVCDFAQAGPGLIWVLARNKGGFLYDTSTGDFKHYMFARSGTPNSVCILTDGRDNTWLGTETGLFLLNRETRHFVPFNAADGILKGLAVATLEEGDDGTLWIGSNNGIFSLDAETQEVRYHLTVRDGLTGNQFNDRASLRARDGRLYFSGINGYSAFRPETLQRNGFVPSVCVTGLLLNDRWVEIDRGGKDSSPLKRPLHLNKELRLKYNQNSVGFTFAALSYQSSPKNRYAYRLAGQDKEWVYSDRNEAHFTNLSPGKYTFEVRGSNDDGVWSENTATVAFVIQPPFYRSTVAVVGYLLLLGLLAWYGTWYVRRKHRLKLAEFALQQEKINYQSKIDFFTNVAHEIRTPLSLIKVPLESILKEDEHFPPKVRDYLHVMEKNTSNLLEMVNQLLDLRKTEDTDYTPSMQTCDVSELVDDLCARFGPAAEVGGISIERSIEPGVVARVDRDAISKIVNNLLSNALKYARSNCCVTLASEGKLFRITISDDGQGIVPEDMERIFNTFYQSGNSKGGTGIGLPLARLLAIKHGGSVVCSNCEQRGAVFTVEIPLNPAAAESGVSSEPGPESSPGAEIPPPAEDNGTCKILVVEDNDDLRSVIAEIIGARYDVLTAANGKIALEVLADNNCDLIVSDIMMPEMDGYELCEYVKSELRYSHIPIIQLTAKTSVEDKVRGLEYGADAYIEKPFSSEHLMAQIDSLIRNRERIRRALLADTGHADTASLGISKRDAEFIEKLNTHIEEHLCEETFYIEQLAEKMFMSRSNFYRKVKSLFGISPNDYMKTYRLRKAAEMIRSGDFLIKEIYEQVGFKTSSYFSACFREEFGMTPKQYKDQNSKSK
ncbi:response regulator [Alistipes sp. kh20]|uniref:hybrid sensor histidine kinase/response regulator transcription factor n=1 Tax=Alistipes montrealensis TaxID=2834113 RepID=UPI001BCB2134|nr:hybrid sensor histidine kinase/response regulator transcription factor [Alistipes montrealensis]MBS4764735.1 response regulator [Alistipes montrealensis]